MGARNALPQISGWGAPSKVILSLIASMTRTSLQLFLALLFCLPAFKIKHFSSCFADCWQQQKQYQSYYTPVQTSNNRLIDANIPVGTTSSRIYKWKLATTFGGNGLGSLTLVADRRVRTQLLTKKNEDDSSSTRIRPQPPLNDPKLCVSDFLALLLASQLIGLLEVVNDPEFIRNGGWFQSIPAVPSTLDELVQRISTFAILWAAASSSSPIMVFLKIGRAHV